MQQCILVRHNEFKRKFVVNTNARRNLNQKKKLYPQQSRPRDQKLFTQYKIVQLKCFFCYLSTMGNAGWFLQNIKWNLKYLTEFTPNKSNNSKRILQNILCTTLYGNHTHRSPGWFPSLFIHPRRGSVLLYAFYVICIFQSSCLFLYTPHGVISNFSV